MTFKPASDANDGHLVNGTTWDIRPSAATIADLLLTCGRDAGNRYDASFGYVLNGLAEDQIVEDVRLRMNEQGGNPTAGLVVEISAALELDPLSVPGADRFDLPRTNQSVIWNIPADVDSSGQRVAKYQESPDISPVLNEVLAQSGWDASTKGAVFFVEVVSPLSGTAFIRTDDMHIPFIGGGNAGILPVRLMVCETLHDTFWGKEMLCRPAPGSVQVNVIPRFDMEAFCEWGTDSFTLSNTTPTQTMAAETAYHFALAPLPHDTPMHYRLRFRRTGEGAFQAGPTHTFVSMPPALSAEEVRICATTDIHVTNLTALGLNPDLVLLEESLETMLDFEPARLASVDGPRRPGGDSRAAHCVRRRRSGAALPGGTRLRRSRRAFHSFRVHSRKSRRSERLGRRRNSQQHGDLVGNDAAALLPSPAPGRVLLRELRRRFRTSEFPATTSPSRWEGCGFAASIRISSPRRARTTDTARAAAR